MEVRMIDDSEIAHLELIQVVFLIYVLAYVSTWPEQLPSEVIGVKPEDRTKDKEAQGSLRMDVLVVKEGSSGIE